MTDERPTTTDAIASLQRGLDKLFPADLPRHGYHLAVDAGTLADALAEFDAARARIAALEAALRDVCEAAVRTDTEVNPDDYGWCVVCDCATDYDGDFHHAPDCPVAAALALLGDA